MRSGERGLTGSGVKREWIAYTMDEALRMLEEIRGLQTWRVGYLSYDFGVRWQGVEVHCTDVFQTPLLHFVEPEEVREVEGLECAPLDFHASGPVQEMAVETYLKSIGMIHHWLREGETYELNFSHRSHGTFDGEPLEMFRRLWQVNPSPHAFFFNGFPITVVSCSPERLIRGKRREDGRLELETRPIKGTVPRGKTPQEDEANRQALLASRKDEAELNMIVDLARNDLGRVCEMGSVNVSEHRVVESYSHVHHTVSTVTGLLREGLDAVDVLQAVFPGGSITGAPKVRTMQLIDRLEPCARGIYTGSAGFIAPDGTFDFNILIRTVAFQREQGLYAFHSGGGIVMDSIPEQEFQETLDKSEVITQSLASV